MSDEANVILGAVGMLVTTYLVGWVCGALWTFKGFTKKLEERNR